MSPTCGGGDTNRNGFLENSPTACARIQIARTSHVRLYVYTDRRHLFRIGIIAIIAQPCLDHAKHGRRTRTKLKSPRQPNSVYDPRPNA